MVYNANGRVVRGPIESGLWGDVENRVGVTQGEG